jgi:hypothetical protein
MKKNKKSDPQLNRDIHRIVSNERFPISNMTKDSREDSEKNHKESKDKSLDEDVNDANSKKSQ